MARGDFNHPEDAVSAPPLPSAAFKSGAGADLGVVYKPSIGADANRKLEDDVLTAWAEAIPQPEKWEYPRTAGHLAFVAKRMVERGFTPESARFLIEVICDAMRHEYHG